MLGKLARDETASRFNYALCFVLHTLSLALTRERPKMEEIKILQTRSVIRSPRSPFKSVLIARPVIKRKDAPRVARLSNI
jgi:hypothetical protein